MNDKYIISYSHGYNDWYVSEFYKYFHKRLEEETNINLEYIPLHELAQKHNSCVENHNSYTLFNWYNLIIFNERTQKYFIHNWSDNSPMMIEYCMNNNIDLVSFSCVTNVKNDDVIEKWKDKVKINPSVYYLNNWSDHHHINNLANKTNQIHTVFFNGLLHSSRPYIMNVLNKNPLFDIRSRHEHFKQGFDYFNEVSDYKFGLSLNGAAHICFRDLELFGMNVLNLRQPFLSKTHNPIIKDVHYIEFIDDKFLYDIFLESPNIDSILKEKIDYLEDFINTDAYPNMLNESRKWFIENVLPENQFKIIYSLLEDFTIFD
jgi:hypothetical protein